jgi:hypothetical protein
MNRNHSVLRALFVGAAMLLATGASAQNPNAAPAAKANAADKADKAVKAEKGAAKDEKALDPSKAKTADDRTSRKAKEHEDQRAKLSAAWKGPVNDALRSELRRHAERLARLERIKHVADGEKDKDSAEKVTKLIAKENERHEKWLVKNVPVVGTTALPTPGAAALPAVPAVGDKKEGAQ